MNQVAEKKSAGLPSNIFEEDANGVKYINFKHKINIIVTGMHLSKKHGETFKDILRDKLKINHYVKIHKNHICSS